MKKAKNIFMKGLSLLLVFVSVTSTSVYAINDNGANSNYQENTVGSNKGEQATLKQEGEVFNDLWQGLRVYVVDEQGSLVVNKNGEMVVDYLYNPSLMTQTNFSKDFNRYYSATRVHYTGIEYAPGTGERNCITRVGNNTAPVVSKSITEMNLRFIPLNDTNSMIDHYPTLCYHSLNGIRSNGPRGIQPHFESASMVQQDVDFDGVDDMGMKYLIYTFYPNQAQRFYEDGYTLCIEHIFAIKLFQNSDQLSGKIFYGSVYEFGLYCQSKNVVKTGSVRDYALNFIPKSLTLGYTPNIEEDGEHCLKNVANLGVPNPEIVGDKYRRVPANDLISDGYGILLYHKELDNPQTEIVPQDPDEPVEPTLQEEIVQVFTLDEKTIDSIDAYTGYRAQEGKYDISTSYGIPTTEYLSNIIYAQDRVVELAFGSEAWVPKEFPVVKYNLYYKEPYEYEYEETCTCNLYDKNGKYVGCTTDHTKTETRYHTGYVTGQSAPIIRVGQYFYVSDYAVYGLESVQVQNMAASAYYTSEMTDLKKNDIKIVTSGVEEPGTISGTDVNKHINFEDVTKWNGHVAGNSEIGHGDFSSKAAAEEWIRSNATSWAEEHVGYPKVKNDYVEIDGVIYLDDKEVTGKENAKSMTNPNTGVVTPNVVLAPMPVDPTKDYKVTHKEQESLFIDAEVPNGKYYTSMQVRYKRLEATNEHPYYLSFDWTASNNDKSHIITNKVLNNVTMNEIITLKNNRKVNYRSQEPIRIITPVIAPSTLRYDEDVNPDTGLENKVSTSLADDPLADDDERNLHGTQLVEEADAQQLRLDETYTITFDTTEHLIYTNGGYYNVANELLLGYGDATINNNDSTWFIDNVFSQNAGFESNSKYDKYVRNKQVKFPFDVYIDDILFAADTWITLYSYDPSTGTASAGDTKTNHLQKFTFYIPPWAEETALETIYSADGTQTSRVSRDFIEIKVESVNADSEKSFEEWNAGDIYNTENDTCIATYRINVQLSGWVYDFKIVGSTPATPWLGAEADDDVSTMFASLSSIHDEFFPGIYNRTGNDSIYNSNDTEAKDKLLRYYDDGKVEAVNERKDTIPLHSGTSEIYPIMGELMKDSDFTFTISTMSNLDENDKIVIKPTFTWYSPDLSEKLENDEFVLYYDNTAIPDRTERYVPYASERDKKDAYYALKLQLNDRELRDTLNSNDIAYLIQKRNLERHDDIVNDTKHNVGYFGRLTLKGTELMTYNTGALEELKINQGRNSDNLINILDDSDIYDSGNISLSSKQNALTESVQTWYGTYAVPKHLYMVKKSDLEAHGVNTLNDYITQQGSIRSGNTDEIFTKDGFLVINFDIVVYKDGQPYLTYEYGTSNQWERQGQRDYAKVYVSNKHISTDKLCEILKKHPNMDLHEAGFEAMETIDIKSGDVAVVDLSQTGFANKYSRLVFTN